MLAQLGIRIAEVGLFYIKAYHCDADLYFILRNKEVGKVQELKSNRF